LFDLVDFGLVEMQHILTGSRWWKKLLYFISRSEREKEETSVCPQ
jgi:hypothetical protein